MKQERKQCVWCHRTDNGVWLVDYGETEADGWGGRTILLHAWCVLEWKHRDDDAFLDDEPEVPSGGPD